MRILVAAYRRKDVAVELFGRTDDGRSISALYFGFRPYFDLVDPSEPCLQLYRSDEEYRDEKDLELWVDGHTRPVKRLFVASPWKVPKLREKCGSKFMVLAADIPFHHRFIYDMDLDPCVKIIGEEIPEEKKNFTTDMVVRIDRLEKTEDFVPPVKILSFDIENAVTPAKGDDYGHILMIGYAIHDGREIRKGYIDGDEKHILNEFISLVNREDPDILTGYNIDGYDLPVIQSRMDKFGIQFRIGRDHEMPRRIQGQYWRLHGRSISDTWWAVKKILHPKHETLNYVAHELLGEGKDNINRLKIEEEWANRRNEVIDYCIKDSYLTLEIFRKLRVVDRNMFMSTVTKLPYDDVSNGGTSNYVDSLLIRKADRQNIGVPMTSRNGKENPIEGGYVHSIGAGIYDNVIVLDFKSMYPSMIMKYNICFTTLDPDGENKAPNGVKFLSSERKRGLVPGLLKDLMQERDAVKARMKTANAEEREYLDGIQGALKILMNTFYGVLASSFYRFTNLDIGSAVTGYARETIKALIEKLTDEKFKVIYGDTDSVFIESGAGTSEEAIRIGRELSERISREEGVVVEFEKVMDPLFSHGAKKRYAGKIVYPESQKGEVLVRGYEVRRTDSFDLQSESLSKVFDLVLNRDLEGAIAYRNEIIRKIREGDTSTINIDDLVISRSVRDFRSYKEQSLANIRVAKKLIEMGETFIPGMKVSWIVTDSKKSPQEVEPYMDGVPFKGTPDWEYYARRVDETLKRVLEGLSEDYSEVEGTHETGSKERNSISNAADSQQKKLFEFS